MEFKYRQHTIEIEQDTYGMNPRTDWNFGTMVCWHRNYNLGDEPCPKNTPREWEMALASELDDSVERRIDWWGNAGYRRLVACPSKETLANTSALRAKLQGCRHLTPKPTVEGVYLQLGLDPKDIPADKEDEVEEALVSMCGDMLLYNTGMCSVSSGTIEEDVRQAAEALTGIEVSQSVAQIQDEAMDSRRARIQSIIDTAIEKNTVMLPLRLFDHSGISMSVGTGAHSCDPGGWDSGQVGWIYVTREKILKEWGGNRLTPAFRKKAERLLRGEVETYDEYLTGNVWGYAVTCPDLDEDLDENCGGYYGDPEKSGCLEDAKSAVDHHCRKLMKESRRKRKAQIRSRCPLHIRIPALIIPEGEAVEA